MGYAYNLMWTDIKTGDPMQACNVWTHQLEPPQTPKQIAERLKKHKRAFANTHSTGGANNPHSTWGGRNSCNADKENADPDLPSAKAKNVRRMNGRPEHKKKRTAWGSPCTVNTPHS